MASSMRFSLENYGRRSRGGDPAPTVHVMRLSSRGLKAVKTVPFSRRTGGVVRPSCRQTTMDSFFERERPALTPEMWLRSNRLAPGHQCLYYGHCLDDYCEYHDEEKSGTMVSMVEHSRHGQIQDWRDCADLARCEMHRGRMQAGKCSGYVLDILFIDGW